MTGLVVLFVLVVLFWAAVALIAHRTPDDAPPSVYTCRSGARVDAEPWGDRTLYGVEGDLDLDDGRPTDPGEELTVVSEPEWAEDTLVSAADELGRVTGPDRGRSS